MFECDCFDCYTSYWFKWDSLPNYELIHQAIEAFEDHVAHDEKSKKVNGRGKHRDKPTRHVLEKPPPMMFLKPHYQKLKKALIFPRRKMMKLL